MFPLMLMCLAGSLLTNVEGCFRITPTAPTANDLRKRYEFLKKFQASSTGSNGSTGDPSKGECPWTYTIDRNKKRLPEELPVAVASFKKEKEAYCKKIFYHHTVLRKKCDWKTGLSIWELGRDDLPIAFVYDPWNTEILFSFETVLL